MGYVPPPGFGGPRRNWGGWKRLVLIIVAAAVLGGLLSGIARLAYGGQEESDQLHLGGLRQGLGGSLEELDPASAKVVVGIPARH